VEPQRAAHRHGLSALAHFRRGASLLLVCTSPFACGKILGIEQGRRAENARGGAAGSGGEGGEGAGPSRGGTTGGGGTAGASGSATSGASGSATGGTAPGGGEGGLSGEGGAGGGGGTPPDPGPTLGGDCDDYEARACSPGNRNIVLTCGGPSTTDPLVWRLLRTCDQSFRCDLEALDCVELQGRCTDSSVSLCAESVLYDCDTDPPNTIIHTCPFGCQNGRCLSGVGDQLIVHTESNLDNHGPWGTSVIPVCFDAGSTNARLLEWTRDEVERSWARYLGVRFEGFEACPEEPTTGVRLEFLRDCRQRLGKIASFGSPFGGQELGVGICESYRDAGDELRLMAQREALFRFVVRHQFGHVLGAQDDRLHLASSMTPYLELSRVGEFGLDHHDLHSLYFGYGIKPFRSLVTTAGYCLAPVEDGIRPASCSEPGAASFDFRNGEAALLNGTTSGCLVVGSEGEPVTVATCGSPASALSFARARWSTPKTCIGARELASGGPARGSAVATEPCAPVGAAAQAWNFEILTTHATLISARIRASATGDCLAVSNEIPTANDVPVLSACSDDTARPVEIFSLWPDGRISFGGLAPDSGALCLAFQGDQGTLALGDCSHRYFLSGPLETPDGLTAQVTSNDPNARLIAVRPDPNAPLSQDQIFDFPL
jgi:hypothetical protein